MADQPDKPEKPQAPAPAAAAQQVQQKQEKPFDGYLAQVVEVVKGRTGIYGEVRQIMAKILEGQDKGRVIRRNIAGKVKVGDYVRLPDTTREAKQIRVR
ncbi:MAG: 30S ribosomal protein S28e [Candidatus Micrarchaeota archaeon]|nr:30S ribosomal protein S28e [Candidatus Micrarchaeota archaeon]MDE1804182.1 30S ribosomal protein S28e [Candidatus Micrarchaeota archaeon]MDE1846710.1 30S ribosomal protein S28e [Candidatus Micrarchaeota archaeon]